MPTSYNGWGVSSNLSAIGSSRAVPGTSIHLSVRYGSAGNLLIYVAEEFHKRVENLQGGASDDGGWNYRFVSGSTSWSNHASATAIDLNWNKHPRGARNTFQSWQVGVIRQILSECHGAIYWGGDYRSPSVVDEMHFEIDTNQAGCDWAWQQIQLQQSQEEDDMPYGVPLDLHGLEVGERKEFTIAPVNTGGLGFGKAWLSLGCDGGDAKIRVVYQKDGEDFWNPLFGDWTGEGPVRLVRASDSRQANSASLPDGTGKVSVELTEIVAENPSKFSASGFIEYGKR